MKKLDSFNCIIQSISQTPQPNPPTLLEKCLENILEKKKSDFC